MLEKFRPAWDWFIARCSERSTQLGIAEALSYAAVLPYPFSLIVFAVRVVVSFVPDKPKAEAPAE